MKEGAMMSNNDDATVVAAKAQDEKTVTDNLKKKSGSQPKLSGIDLLKYRQKQLVARIADMEAREKNHERKKDTRRKILIGAYYLDKARKIDAMDELAHTLDDYLKRDSDRALFGVLSVNPRNF
jgi:large subunit ribosomal protein L7/L12